MIKPLEVHAESPAKAALVRRETRVGQRRTILDAKTVDETVDIQGREVHAVWVVLDFQYPLGRGAQRADTPSGNSCFLSLTS